MKKLSNSYKIDLPSGLIFWLFLLGFCLRVFLAYIYGTYGPNYVFSDEQFYKGTVDKFWYYWRNASFFELFDYNKYAFGGFAGRNFGYNIIYALVSHWFGEFGGRVANSLFVCLAAYFTYLIAMEISERKVATFAYCLVLFYPSGILYSVTLHKEAFVIFSIALSVLCLTKLFKKISIKWMSIFIISFLCLFTSRVYIPILILLAVSLVLIWNSKRNPFSWIIALILIAFMIYYLPDVIKQSINLDALLLWRHKAVSSVGTYWNTYRILGLPVSLTALVFYSFQPLPWNFTSIWFIPVNLGSLVWYMIFPFFLLGLVRVIKSKQLRLIGAIILIIAVFYIFIYVTGTEFRHREQMLSLLAVVSAIGYYRFKSMPFSRRLVFVSIPFGIMAALGFYKLWSVL